MQVLLRCFSKKGGLAPVPNFRLPEFPAGPAARPANSHEPPRECSQWVGRLATYVRPMTGNPATFTRKNAMTTKNPFMSMWLSGANAWLGAGRGLWMAEMQRQQTAMMNEFTRQAIRFWTGAWALEQLRDKDSRPDRR
ncbi:MAG TPA: hypothetical protein VK943_20795 [Arenibaculum sp.]|nr:hypothetical protein [Arenibaculum sp.]